MYFSGYRTYTSLVQFIPKYFGLFDTVMDGYLFLSFLIIGIIQSAFWDCLLSLSMMLLKSIHIVASFSTSFFFIAR